MNHPSSIAQLADNITRVTSADIGESARAAARLAILDVLGCAVAGAGEAAPKSTREWAQATFGAGPCSLWFAGRTSHILGAVTANAAAGSAMDGDDTHWPSWMHSGSSIVPAALAACESAGATGHDLIEAVVIGYEVTTRIAESVDWDRMTQIATGHWCGFGAAAAVARIRGASVEDLRNAFSVVAAVRPQVYAPSDTLNLNGIKEGIAWATMAGVAALDMGSFGLSGPMHALDEDLYDTDTLLKSTGSTWNIEDVSVKPFASCAWTHAPAEALWDLMQDNDLHVEDIAAVTVTTFPQATTYINNDPAPDNLEAAQYNIPFNVAVMAHDGPAGLLPLRGSTVQRGELTEFAKRVTLMGSKECEAGLPSKHQVHVSVDARQGTYERSLDSETSPVDLRSVTPKFQALTTELWEPAKQQRVIDAVTHLGEGTLGELVADLQAPLLDRTAQR